MKLNCRKHGNITYIDIFQMKCYKMEILHILIYSNEMLENKCKHYIFYIFLNKYEKTNRNIPFLNLNIIKRQENISYFDISQMKCQKTNENITYYDIFQMKC